ncbi:hypothetical protein D3C81_1485020 [compost metagenome]
MDADPLCRPVHPADAAVAAGSAVAAVQPGCRRHVVGTVPAYRAPPDRAGSAAPGCAGGQRGVFQHGDPDRAGGALCAAPQGWRGGHGESPGAAVAGGRRAAPALESRLDRQGLRRRDRRRDGRSGAGRRPASPSELRADPLQGRGCAALRLQRHQRAQADGSCAGRGQAHGGCGERGEDAVPGDHEP